ncbi:ribosome silencing factor [Desulfobacca acetoxidans]|uniref:ribosome silencing factor n=1 Tax=Desulfobacca acetoxidans TaxID=60893 RepID=UPI000A03B1EC|nr:ribosome silencing factor [Desulfobacca acetoxidans]
MWTTKLYRYGRNLTAESKSTLSAQEKVDLCVNSLREKKAIDVVVLDVRPMSSFADFFIICSGASHRQVQALAEHVEAVMRQHGLRPLGVEGSQEARWILLDCNDVIIHIFYQPWREFYDLEGLWLEAPRQSAPESIVQGAES